MQTKRCLILVAALILTCAYTPVARAAGGGPKDFLQSHDKKLNALIVDTEKNKAKIVKIVNKMLDFQTLCQESLGKHWEQRSPAEREEFSSTLKALIEKNLIERMKNTKDRKISYEKESVDGNKGSVVTMLSTGDGPRAEKTEIEYKMMKKGNSWGVVDMVTDGVSLVSNYRSQFNKIIQEDGWDALIKKMKDKLAG